MKPTKNQVFCLGCQKYKMLFESKSKANNFIKFNAGEILEENKKAPVRSYYCTLCIGWHVTSNPSIVEGERLDGRDEKLIHQISRYKQNKKDVSIVSQRINIKLQEFEMHLNMGEFDKAEDALDICGFDIEDAKSFTMVFDKVGKLQERVGKARDRLDKYKELNNMNKEEQDELLNNPEPTKNECKVMVIIKDLRSLSVIKSVIDNQMLLVNSDDTPMVLEIVDKCRGYIESLSGEGTKRAKSQFRKKLDKILRDRSERRKSCQNDEVIDTEPINEIEEEQVEIVEASNVEADSSPVYSSEYKANILELIQKIEKINSEYEEGNFDECEDILDLCFYILDDMKKDNNTRMIKQQLDNWKHKLEDKI